MSVKYALHPNPLTDNPRYYRAIIQNQRSCTLEDIIDQMMNSGSTVGRADALAVIEEYYAAITWLLSQGYIIRTPMMRVSVSISGNFDGPEDRFYPARHRLNLNVQPGPRPGKILRKIPVRKVSPASRYPSPRSFRDAASGTVNKRVTPGGAGVLSGRLLKVDMNDQEQGVFFVASDGTRTRVPRLIRNTPSELVFVVPGELPAGEYRIEVHALVRRTSRLRSGRIDVVLTVCPKEEAP